MCITKADSVFFVPKQKLQMVKCIDAIGIGDSREIFVIDVDWQIRTYLDNFCLEIGDNSNENKYAWTKPCIDSN